jgi:quinol-cytochrome oxidoreductase complex cytochrome b subunit
MELQKLKKFVQFDTAGWIAISALLLCGLSGILLAIPYDFSRAYPSIFELLLFSPAGSFIRNFHYWSAQAFFISALLHIYDHISKSTETNIRSSRTWLILCIAAAFLGYEMLSGFILKGDAAGLQARRILASLLESVPVVGKMLSSAFTGSEEHWLIVYVQHTATGTIILFMAVYEHLKSIWPRLKTIAIVFAGLFLISLIFRAPLGLQDSNQLKGPWFFLGIQEMLHWTSYPVYIFLLFAVLFLLLVFLPRFSEKGKSIIKMIFLIGGICYLLVTLLVFLFRGENWEGKNWTGNNFSDEPTVIFDPVKLFEKKTPVSLSGNVKIEGCLVCHGAMKGLSESHNPAATGCFACHRGDPFSSDKLTAHQNMILVPGNFSNVRQTCGTQNCHREISDRLMGSLMTSESGIIGIDKFVFGETTSLNDTFHMKNIGHSAADAHLRNLCAGCHLGNEKMITGNADWLERGGGCNACHLQYNDKVTASMKRMQSKTGDKNEEIHPTIDIQVSNERCKSCHSRSGRISLSYEGWNETSLKPTEISDTVHFRILPDDRVLEYVQADVHHQKGMACIDCHGSYEIMGDGKGHIHKEDAVKVQCIDCHPSGKPNSTVIHQLTDRESLMIAGLRKVDPKTRVVMTSKGKLPLLNTFVDSLDRIFLTDKLTGKIHASRPMSPACSKGKGHSRLGCETCHSAWVPQCIGCHTAYEKNTTGVDMLTGNPTTGSWVEYAGKCFAEPPVLGISENAGGKVVMAMPGMIMTIDQESFQKGKGQSFFRLYAPASGHTTQRVARSCKSCHNNSLAIGYGRGELKYNPSGETIQWTFEPRFALNENDQLPEDAWIGFLQEAKSPFATRNGLRPFTVKEQMRILEVGSCLTCHDEKSKVMERALENFQLTQAKRSKKCVLPIWVL